MKVRERSESLEYKILSPFASKSKESSRVVFEEPCDFRTAYQRDRDRIIHAKSFRRLKHKTQVYIATGDHYRMRMTHSLEVAQIARTIARGLQLNEDLTEAIALGHDVGHTPFGHAGEETMRVLIGHFCHNEQSLRTVDYIERQGKGLNLTLEVRDGILCHTGKNKPNTLEGKIVRTADRIAYLCHDYDDSIRAKMLSSTDLPLKTRQILGIKPSDMITAMVSDMIVSSAETGDILLSSAIKEAMDEFRDFMFTKVYHSERLADERQKAAFIIEVLYQHFLKNPDMIPDEFLQREDKWGLNTIVVDYIAGLTDIFAIQLFNKIFVPSIYVNI